jgi:hypothetical protein
LALRADTELKDIYFLLHNAVRWLDAFTDKSDVFRFTVSIEAAERLREFIYKEFTQTPAPDFNRKLTVYEAGRFEELTRDFETVAAAEVGTFNTYYVVKKLAYDTNTLTNEGDALLPEEIRTKVPRETLEDLREAAKCMAFEVNTAAGFHTIRATEAVIRSYYSEVVGATPRAKDRNWGAYIRVLRGKGADPRVTGYLDHIREAYRNPIAHPEQRLTPNEAQVLLGVCVSAIVQIVGAIDALHAMKAVATASAAASGPLNAPGLLNLFARPPSVP